jgi:hypothetical protein
VPKTKENAKRSLYAIPVKPEIEIAYMIFEARQGKHFPFANPTFNTLSNIAKALGKN